MQEEGILEPFIQTMEAIPLEQRMNFIGAFEELDDKKIQPFMQEFGRDWIKWKQNSPFASHIGGVWERQICSA